MLSQVYTGPLEGMPPVRIGEPGAAAEATLRASDLLKPAEMTRVLERFGASYSGGDRRAIASLWSKWHLSNVIAHALATNLLLDRDLPLALEETRITLSPEGYTVGLHLPHEGGVLAAPTPYQRFQRLINRHLAPLIDALSAWSGAAPRVFWSNAGNYFEHFAHALEQHPLAAIHTSTPALELLDTAVFDDGKRNPLYRPIRYQVTDEGTQRIRQLCCLRYLLPEVEYCGNCPLTCPKPARKPTRNSA